MHLEVYLYVHFGVGNNYVYLHVKLITQKHSSQVEIRTSE